ncbi:MAG: alpha/beta fold hydrolase [Candidatus Berkiella sp.]
MNMILIHGSWHGAWCWEKVIPLLEAAGHNVFALDLPCHGEDSRPRKGVTLETYVNCVEQLLQKLAVPSMLVGHSMGGIVISQVAEKLPEKIAKLVYLAGFMPENGDSLLSLANQQPLNDITASIRGVPAENALYFPMEHMKSFAYNACPSGTYESIASRFCVEPFLPSATPVTLTNERYGRVERVYIECSEDNAIALSSQKRMIQRSPCQVFQLACDHSPFYSDPEGLASILMKLA